MPSSTSHPSTPLEEGGPCAPWETRIAVGLPVLCLTAGALRRAHLGWDREEVFTRAYAMGARSRHPSAVRLLHLGPQLLLQRATLACAALAAVLVLVRLLLRPEGERGRVGRRSAEALGTLLLAGLCAALTPILL